MYAQLLMTHLNIHQDKHLWGKPKLGEWLGLCHKHHCLWGGRINKSSAEMKIEICPYPWSRTSGNDNVFSIFYYFGKNTFVNVMCLSKKKRKKKRTKDTQMLHICSYVFVDIVAGLTIIFKREK